MSAARAETRSTGTRPYRSSRLVPDQRPTVIAATKTAKVSEPAAGAAW